MDQDAINQKEWKDPANWSDPFFGFYFSKADSRTWVPKQIPWMGWTLNLGKPSGACWMVGFLIGLPLAATVVTVLVMTQA